MRFPLRLGLVFAGSLLTAAGSLSAQTDSLAGYFGFTGAEITKIGDGAGPMTVADLDGDGLHDIIVVNSRQSQLDLLYQKPDASPDEVDQTLDVNELPSHWRFRREELTVSHTVTVVTAHDVDGDGLVDLIYVGRPGELVVMRQDPVGVFDTAVTHRVRGIAAGPDGLAIVDVLGNEDPEVCVLVDAGIHIFPMTRAARPRFGDPVKLTADDDIVAFFAEDFDGDGRADLLAVIPEHDVPLRLWLQHRDAEGGYMGPELRMKMPPLREVEPVRFANRDAASIAVIERLSKRLAVYDLVAEPIDEQDEQHIQAEVFSFTNPETRDRSVTVGDVDGDGLLDVIATDSDANAVVVFRQAPKRGLLPGTLYPSLKGLSGLAVGMHDGDGSLEVAVLSKDEKIVGLTRFHGAALGFPTAVSIVTPGSDPVAMTIARLQGTLTAAVIVKKKRDHVLELHPLDDGTESTTVELEGVSRSPTTIRACDADQDDQTDLLLFTPNEPMTVVRASESGIPDEVLTDEKMPQFGLVSAATDSNTALFDMDGDGKDELLIADVNFVRACRYDTTRGWTVVEQVNAADAATKLVSVGVLGRRIVAADRENERLLIIGRGEDDGQWSILRTLDLQGFRIRRIFTGAFSGDGRPNILCTGDAGFAVVRLAGERLTLHQFADHRTDEEDRLEHEIEAGDVNADGHMDLIVLDAGEQMLEILTFSKARRLHPATEFEVFQSRLFDGGYSREFEPRQLEIADVTGDGAPDVIVLVHDRIIVYPQMTTQD
ncbi:MAG: VCBS repeat-containing protein [Phycisphaerales bacterium]|nr:VCBS repeat-containing protein [Phycisphaerales bacterium]